MLQEFCEYSSGDDDYPDQLDANLRDDVLVRMMVETKKPRSGAVPRENRRELTVSLFQHQADQYTI
jgi:hypothetical protein